MFRYWTLKIKLILSFAQKEYVKFQPTFMYNWDTNLHTKIHTYITKSSTNFYMHLNKKYLNFYLCKYTKNQPKNIYCLTFKITLSDRIVATFCPKRVSLLRIGKFTFVEVLGANVYLWILCLLIHQNITHYFFFFFFNKGIIRHYFFYCLHYNFPANIAVI